MKGKCEETWQYLWRAAKMRVQDEGGVVEGGVAEGGVAEDGVVEGGVAEGSVEGGVMRESKMRGQRRCGQGLTSNMGHWVHLFAPRKETDTELWLT